MKAIFVESSIFEKNRRDYLSDEEFQSLQVEMLAQPLKGDLIQGTGGDEKQRKTKWR